MNILIVYCHPSERSYTFQVLTDLKTKLQQRNWNIEVSDLYAIDFAGDMTKQEYDREGFAKTDLPISADVLAEHRKIDKADCIIFLYPVWWSDCPAKMKGWFDRVYSVGYAYYHNEHTQKMKKLKLGLVVCTAGYTAEHLAELGIAQSMQKIMLDDRLGERFTHKQMLILGGTLNLEQVRHEHMTQIEELPTIIKQYCA